MHDQTSRPAATASSPAPSAAPSASAVSTSMALGAVARLSIRCISEVGWFDTPTLLGDIGAAGGIGVSQYRVPWPPFGDLHTENAGGSAALLEAETTTGDRHRILFDTGWNPQWMERRFAEEGVDRLLAEGAIDCLVISHEHFDHFWGIGVPLKHCPGLPIYIPAGFHAEGRAFIHDQGHTGPLIEVPPQEPLLLFPGCAVVAFPMETLLQVTGENVLYFGIAGHGLAMVTGCGHGGVLNLLDYARHTFVGGERVHAVYGGLHIAPFEDWNAEKDALIEALAGRGIEHLGCNHCTGALAVQKMIDAGMPVVRGSARHGSRTDLFLGNGDCLDLPMTGQS
jgi:7,8-dihydropterin-6-yl-methyl-4-(beta-D-ribofuranosyl)aminobenzene 5'-phosphate synthase